MDFGFIITRHVRCTQTNEYWNRSVNLLRRWYPRRKIVIIDDNSNQEFVKAFREYQNVEVIQSEFPGRGELLPYYYFHKDHFFDTAIILHDSVFFHRRVHFEKFHKFNAVPFWNFCSDKENCENSLHLISGMKNRKLLAPYLLKANTTADSVFKPSNTSGNAFNAQEFPILGMPKSSVQQQFGEWKGCFGVQALIKHSFLSFLVQKYDLFQLLKTVQTKKDRCGLERIFGILFFLELKLKTFSLFGDIHHHNNSFDYTYDKYKHDLYVNKRIPKAVTKVWTGR
jgi:hypothetical protein